MIRAKNPHLLRLKRHRNWQKLAVLFDPNNISLWFMVIITGSCCAMADAFYLGSISSWLLAARVFAIIFAPIPWLMAGAAAYFVSVDIRANRLDLLRLTPLSERQIMWGYIGATLFRFRYVLRVAFGSMIFAFAGMFLAGWGSSYNYVAPDYIVLWTAYIIHYIGICLVILMLAATLALRISFVRVLGIWLPFIATLAIALSATLSLQLIQARLTQPINIPLAFRDGFILITIPYLILAGSWIMSLRWAGQD